MKSSIHKANRKELFLIRHAKSSWADPRLNDHDRPLSKRGKRDVPVMGQRLASCEAMPDLVIASTAKRAKKTARGICKQLSYPKKNIIYNPTLYTSDIMHLYQAVQACDDQIMRLFLVSHNFVITDFACELTNEKIVNIPTCGIVAMRLTVDSWSQVIAGSGRLLFFDYPKKQR